MTKSILNATLDTITPFEFEKTVDAKKTVIWMKENWQQSIYWSAIYVSIIFTLQRIMKNRKPLDLKIPLVMWNSSLALFSIISSIRMVPILIKVIYEMGFTFSVCFIEPILYKIQPTIFWAWLFACSKIIEFGDTIFIILRKKKLIFLHWYHHMVTLVLTWYTAGQLVGVIHWFCVMNFAVHSFMYTYYTFSALGIKIPRVVAMFITSMQVLQMVVGSFVNIWAIWKKMKGDECDFPNNAIIISLLVYLNYLYLFTRLFYFSYIAKYNKHEKKL